MKRNLLVTVLLFTIALCAKGQLNYHLGIQFPYAGIKSTQLNVGYDFMKEDRLYFGLYSGYQVINNKDNKHNREYTYYRFPFGIRYYFKTKQDSVGYAPFIGFNYIVSPIIRTKVADYNFSPDITNLGFGIALGVKVFLAKRWEFLVAGNYNFDYDSLFPKNKNRDNILFEDSGILVSIGYNIDVSLKNRK